MLEFRTSLILPTVYFLTSVRQTLLQWYHLVIICFFFFKRHQFCSFSSFCLNVHTNSSNSRSNKNIENGTFDFVLHYKLFVSA